MLVFTQRPLQHCSEPAHTRPHAPQCPTFVWMSTHSPVQQRVPPAHGPPAPQRQAPLTQLSPAAHGGSHGTSAVQLPPMQTFPLGQALPHVPQFIGSVASVRHAPSQQLCPAPQAAPVPHMQAPAAPHVSPAAQGGEHGGSWQTRSTQICPLAQRVPHAPHAIGSLTMSAQRPSQQTWVPVQAGPAPQRHSPPAQTFVWTTQAFPHEPQSVSALVVLTHAPSQHERPPSHGSSGEQPATQLVPRHTVPAGHSLGQPGPASGGGGV